MTYPATVFRILIASPSDVANERKAIPEVIYSWNAIHSAQLGVILLPVTWETHSRPEMGDRPQAIINKQLVKDCDFLIGTFWTRIGSHTGVAESGTVEEIQELSEMGKPVMLYFSSAPVIPDSVDLEQYARLTDFRKKCEQGGLVQHYGSIAELREKLSNHLSMLVRNVITEETPTSIATITNDVPSEEENQLNMIKEQFGSFLSKYRAEWTSEKDSEPYNIEDGKYILKRMGLELLEFRSMLERKVDDGVIQEIDSIVTDTKRIQKHRLTLDGGKSHREFWQFGDDAMLRVLGILNIIK